jgi:protein phosphatase
VITRCVGAGEAVEPDTYTGTVKIGDLYLVASDGLTGMVDDRRLQQLLLARSTAQRIVEALISEANGRGGLDNITAIVIRISDESLDESTPTRDMPAVRREP